MSVSDVVVIMAIPVGMFAFLAFMAATVPNAPTSMQRTDAARTYADTLGLHVLGVSCHGETCSIAYQANDGPRVIVATCDADFCTGVR